MTDKDKIFAAVVICAATAVVSLAAGLAAERRSADVPQVEIIDVAAPAVSTVPTVAEVTAADVSEARASTEADAKVLMVNINTASADELDRLKGIGEATASAIIEYREQTPFEKIEDIMKVKGIGEKKFEDIKDNICV